MKTYWLTILLMLPAIPQLGAIEVYVNQSWELSHDNQQDGWVDSGDRILVTTEISTYDSLANDLIFINPKKSPYLLLLSHTIKASHGIITTTDDSSGVKVQAISLKSIGEKAFISFEYEVDFLPNQADEISILNQAAIIMGDRQIDSNIIDIALKVQNQVQGESLLANKYVLLGIVTLILLLGASVILKVKTPAKLGITA